MRQAMGRLFSITVKLEAPRSGPGSMRHWEQLQQDSQDLMAEANRRHLASLLPSKWGPLPHHSLLCTYRCLSDRSCSRPPSEDWHTGHTALHSAIACCKHITVAKSLQWCHSQILDT